MIRQSYFCVFIYSLLLALLILVMAARPVVVYIFQVRAPFSNKNAKFWPVLAIFAYFVINLCFFWCPFLQAQEIVWWCAKIEKYEVWLLIYRGFHTCGKSCVGRRSPNQMCSRWENQSVYMDVRQISLSNVRPLGLAILKITPSIILIIFWKAVLACNIFFGKGYVKGNWPWPFWIIPPQSSNPLVKSLSIIPPPSCQ